MAKHKTKITQNKREYLYIAIGILIILFCLLLLGRVGKLSTIFLFVSFLLGDFTSLILFIVIVVSILGLILNKKFDTHHIYFIGGILIYIGASLFCHLGLYEPLNMNGKNILSKTLDLYSRYLSNYERSYSCGGGILIACIAQIVGMISGKIGIILVATSFLIIGGSYIIDIDIFKILKGGKVKTSLVKGFKGIRKYIGSINYPNKTEKAPKIPLTVLMDNEEPVSFTIQEQINKERYKELEEYIKTNRISCVLSSFSTSYTSSRFIAKLPHKSELVEREISGYFNKCCFFIKNNLELSIEVTNQFKKLLTLKSILMSYGKRNKMVLAIDVDNNGIEYDLYSGNVLCILGEETSGIKTFVRGFIASLLIKGHLESSIYIYDLYNEFQILENTKIHYMNNEKSAEIGLEEAFSEYERRIDAFKYLNVENIIDANKKIQEMGTEYEPLKPIFHIFFLKSECNQALLQKLSYVLQFGVKVGMTILVISRDKKSLFKINLHNSDILSFYISDISTSVKLFGSDMACRLQKKGDVLYQSGNKIYHGQTPYISLDDFENIINRL
ncbi:MAG: hypothetical protein IJA65_04565 [Acholeplasmatales bacterium]|nr:hypothetical protein [Acholeplasmatales bacterium]